MSNHEHVKLVLSALSGQGETITCPRAYCDFMGSLPGGVFLNQVVFWSDKGRDPECFYKTHREWTEETTLSKYQVSKFTKQCEEMGFLYTEVRKVGNNPTLHYFLDHEAFINQLVKFLTNRKSKISLSESQKSDKQKVKKRTNLLYRRSLADDYAEDHASRSLPEPPRVATDSEINTLITQLTQTAKEVFVLGSVERKFEEHALTLFTLGATREKIEQFGDWWESSGYYDGKPWLSTMTNHWADFTAGKNLNKNTAPIPTKDRAAEIAQALGGA